jgi:deoxyribodipyrimidine photolyase
VPELRDLNSKDIHAPWEKNINVFGYPNKPIVDHKIIKERAMNAYNFSKIKNAIPSI